MANELIGAGQDAARPAPKINTITCGDCLEVMPLIRENITAIITDPPFGIGFKYESHEDDFDSMRNYCKTILDIFNGKTIAIWQSMKNVYRIHEWCNINYRLIADINSCPPYRNHSIQYCWEPIVLIAPPKKNANIKSKDYLITWKPSWHNAKKKTDYIDHPCVRPLESVIRIIELLTNEGDIILDPFMGSGTTAIACINTGRNYIGIEKEEKYCRIAEERIHALRSPAQNTKEICHTAPNSASPKAAQISMELEL